MSKTLSLGLPLAGVLLAALLAQAKGPKTTIIVTSDAGVASASVDVTLCGTADCSSEGDVCPNTSVTGPNMTVKTACPINNSGVKPVLAYRYAVSVNQTAQTDCHNVNLVDTPAVCQMNGGTITVSLK